MINIKQGPPCKDRWRSWEEIKPLLSDKTIVWAKSNRERAIWGPYLYLYNKKSPEILYGLSEGGERLTNLSWVFQIPACTVVVQAPGTSCLI